MPWRELPVGGAVLQELSVHGTGKDCMVCLRLERPSRVLLFEMRDPRLAVDVRGSLVAESFSKDDRDLGVRYLPQEDLRVESLGMDLGGGDEEWGAILRALDAGHRDPIPEVVRVARIVVRPADEMSSRAALDELTRVSEELGGYEEL